MSAALVEIRQPGQDPFVIEVDREVEVGRATFDVAVQDASVSRRHLGLRPDGAGVIVADLGSSYGTTVNDVRLEQPMRIGPGDVVRFGSSVLRVIEPATSDAPAPPGSPTPSTPSPPTPSGRSGPAATPLADALATRQVEGGVLRYRPGSPAEAALDQVATALPTARRSLTGFGSEPSAGPVTVLLVDPFPDPEQPGEIVTEGTIVHAERGEIWMVVTAESPPEPLERPLTLLFGAQLPAAGELELPLEGYGLHLAGAPDHDATLAAMDLPPLSVADGELRAAMAVSFVRFLLDRDDEETLRRWFSSAAPGRLDVAAQEVFGSGLARLEEAWRRRLVRGEASLDLRSFLRLARRELRPHRRKQAEIWVYLVLGLLFTLAFPFVFRTLLDDAIPNGELSRSISLLGLLGGLFAVSLLAELRRAHLAAKVSGAIISAIRTRMFDRLQRLSAGWLQRHEAGDVLSRFFSDVAEVEAGISQVIREGIAQLLTILVASVVLLVLSPLLGAVVLLGAPVVAFTYKRMAAGALSRSVTVQERSGAMLALTSENYRAQPVVKAFSLEQREGERFRRSSQRLYEAQVSLHLFGGLFSLSVNGIVTLLRLVVLGLGAWLILRGSLTIGGLVAFMGVMGEVLSPVSTLTDVGQQLQRSTGALHRVNDILDAELEVDDRPDAAMLPRLSRDIVLDGVTFGYDPTQPVLHDVNCTIPAGARVAFVGPSGAGKSSVISLITRSYDPQGGAVRFDGRELTGATLASLRGQLGVVLQDTFLFDTTVRENIRIGRLDATDAEVEAAARAAAAHDFIIALPGGYDTPVGEGGGRLSGGQRQRLSIARALLRDPAVLVLDEATSALDPRTERTISDTLAEVGQGRTTVAVTHRLTSCVDYDRIFVLVAGELVEQGRHDELLARAGVYAQLWAEQTGAPIPDAPDVDAAAALASLPLFAEVDPSELAVLAGRMRPEQVAAGAAPVPLGDRLMLVRRGQLRVLEPGIDGSLHATSTLSPGDTAGVAALTGADHHGLIDAPVTAEVLVLERDALVALSAQLPGVAAALQRGAPVRAAAAPSGGTRLSRATVALRAVPAVPTLPDGSSTAASTPPGRPAAVLPDVDDIRRTHAAIPKVR